MLHSFLRRGKKAPPFHIQNEIQIKSIEFGFSVKEDEDYLRFKLVMTKASYLFFSPETSSSVNKSIPLVPETLLEKKDIQTQSTLGIPHGIKEML